MATSTTRRTAREIAFNDLAAAENRVSAAESKVKALQQQLADARSRVKDLKARRDYLALNPLLASGASADVPGDEA